jgi:predicted PurR-regulated permease PerM
VNTENITAWTGTLGGALLHRLFLFLITLVALFLVLRDGAWLADHALATVGRLLGDPGERLVSKIADAIRATVNGTVAAAILKGAIIGIGYVLSGVPHPLLFTVLTMTLAMVPLGAWLALAAAALILPVHDGSWLVAAGLFSFGAATLLIGENVIPDRNSWRYAIVWIAWPVPGARDHGGAADHMARMDRGRELIGDVAVQAILMR